jgi:hypothetical protein
MSTASSIHERPNDRPKPNTTGVAVTAVVTWRSDSGAGAATQTISIPPHGEWYTDAADPSLDSHEERKR